MKRLLNASNNTIRFCLGATNKRVIISLLPNGIVDVKESDFNSGITHLIDRKLLDCVDVVIPETPVVIEPEGNENKSNNEEKSSVFFRDKKKGKRN